LFTSARAPTSLVYQAECPLVLFSLSGLRRGRARRHCLCGSPKTRRPLAFYPLPGLWQWIARQLRFPVRILFGSCSARVRILFGSCSDPVRIQFCRSRIQDLHGPVALQSLGQEFDMDVLKLVLKLARVQVDSRRFVAFNFLSLPGKAYSCRSAS